MALNDPLANALSNMLNCEKTGKPGCTIKQVSKLIKDCLKIAKDHKYIGDYKVIETNQGQEIELQLLGKINKCGVIKPRFAVKADSFEKFEKRYLPAKNFGLIIVSTPKGILTHNEAVDKKLGGRLIAYIY